MYAIRALFDIAFHGDGTPVSGKDIAAREDIPHRFLEQILLQLKRGQLVTSKRGPSGGYLLAGKPEEINMLMVVEAIDGTLTPPEADTESGDVQSKTVTDALWRDVANAIQSTLAGVTLSDMVKRGEALGVRKDGQDVIFYVI